MTADVVVPAAVPLPPLRRYRRVLETLRTATRAALRVRLQCLLIGHDDSFAREPRRLLLRCEACGRETAGWAIGPGVPASTAVSPAQPDRHVGLAATVRLGPWTLRQRDGRGAARDRERQRLVAAAARAAEPVAAGAIPSYVKRPVSGRQPGRPGW